MNRAIRSLLIRGTVVGILAFPGAASATDITIVDSVVGIAGVTDGQTARLNVLYPPDSVVPPDRMIPCTAILQIRDMNGNVVAEKTVRALEPGQLMYLDVIADDRNEFQRHQLYGVLHIDAQEGFEASFGADMSACSGLRATFEILDGDTGKTTAVSGLERTTEVVEHREGGEPTPVGIVRITDGQTARLNVLYPPDSGVPPDPMVPCTAILQIRDMNGNVVAEKTVRALEPGQLVHLDFSRDPGDGIDTVIEVYGMAVDAPDLSVCGAFGAALEVFDNDTGKTTVISPEPIVVFQRPPDEE